LSLPFGKGRKQTSDEKEITMTREEYTYMFKENDKMESMLW